MRELYPPIEPYDHGMLAVGDGHAIYWETCGNPRGMPAVVLHGGPGQGCVPRMRQMFDPSRYRAVLFDQRGSGRSTPRVSDPATDLSANTTAHLLADLERLREHLGIERWLVSGGSWGATLGLAYAERHPARVSALVLTAVTTSRRAESDWLYRGAARFFPEAWERFCAEVPDAARGEVTDLAAAYGQLLADPDAGVRERAARAWCAWEDTVLSLEPGVGGAGFSDAPLEEQMAVARLTAHYVAHGAWLDEGALLRDAGRLAGIPGVLIHGRMDLSCPAETAWALARAWPAARLFLLDRSGHRGSAEKREILLGALDAFARG